MIYICGFEIQVDKWLRDNEIERDENVIVISEAVHLDKMRGRIWQAEDRAVVIFNTTFSAKVGQDFLFTVEMMQMTAGEEAKGAEWA